MTLLHIWTRNTRVLFFGKMAGKKKPLGKKKRIWCVRVGRAESGIVWRALRQYNQHHLAATAFLFSLLFFFWNSLVSVLHLVPIEVQARLLTCNLLITGVVCNEDYFCNYLRQKFSPRLRMAGTTRRWPPLNYWRRKTISWYSKVTQRGRPHENAAGQCLFFLLETCLPVEIKDW